MEAGDNRQISLILREYKQPNGAADFPALFSIPTKDRISEMAKQDFQKINMLIIGALTVCFEGMNLKKGMNEMQILTLSEHIIDSSAEDNLSFEDFMLFLQNMILGKYEMSYESMDIPKFMRIFEVYRQDRHEAIQDYRYNMHLSQRGIGDATRSTKTDEISEHLGNMTGRLKELKDALRSKTHENTIIKKADKFYGDK